MQPVNVVNETFPVLRRCMGWGGVEINRNEVSYEMGTQSRKPFQSKSHATNGTGIFTYMKTINLEEM